MDIYRGKRIIKKAGWVLFGQIRNKKELLRLSECGSDTAALLSKALSDVFQRNYSVEENELMKKIENLRSELNDSKEVITSIDYGAGSPESKFKPGSGREISRTLGYFAKGGSKSIEWSRILFKLIREIKPNNCLELGTCVGISASYQAAGLKLNGNGKLYTLEGSEKLASLSENNFKKLGLDNIQIKIGTFDDTLEKTLDDMRNVDFVFIDGDHRGESTIRYFEKIMKYASKNAIIIFDDISWSSGMEDAWRRIISDSRVKIAIDLFNIGIVAVNCDLKKQDVFRVYVK